MKRILALEESAMFGAALGLFYYLGVDWWWYLLLLLGPDISMIGYAVGNRTGAALYNIFHHKGIAIAVGGIGLMLNDEHIMLAGICLFGHSSMDRMFGYGLKHNEGFAYTHLGKIGKEKYTQG